MQKIAFLGLGIMGRAMCANLLKAGFEVTVWNRTAERCSFALEMGARQAVTPREAAAAVDVTLVMVSDPTAARAVYFGPDGAWGAMGEGKSYIDFSTVDAGTSRAIGEAVIRRGARFLEAPVSGTKQPAEQGTLVILTAGDESLHREAEPILDIVGKRSFYLGQTGAAAKMKLVVNMIMGSMMAAFCEGLALADRSGLRTSDLLDVLSEGALANPMFAGKGPLIQRGEFAPAFPLQHAQKDLRLAALLGDELAQPLPVAAAANAAFLQARALGLSESDFSAVYRAIATPS